MIREEMLNADGLIFVSPVYAHQVTALMKNFIDRFAYVLHRPCFLDKAALIISTTELTGLEDVLDSTKSNFPVIIDHKKKLKIIYMPSSI